MNACIEQVLLGVDFPDVCGASSCFWAACRVRAGCSATNLRSADTTNKARPAVLYNDPSVKLYNHVSYDFGSEEKALVGAFSVIVKTGCGTDRALHSSPG